VFALKNEWTTVMRIGVMGVGEVVRQRDLKVIYRAVWWRTCLLAVYTDKKQR